MHVQDLKGSLQSAQGRHEEAIKLLLDTVERERNLGYWEPPHYSRPALESLALAYTRAGKYGKAVDAYEDLLKLRPNTGFAYLGMARVYVREGKNRKGAESYRRFLDAWKYADKGLPQVAEAVEISEKQQMKSVFFSLIFTLVAAVIAAAQSGTVAFTGVNVIPMDRERVLINQTVIVRDGTIAEIGPTGKIKVPKGAQKIDARGKFLIPGLTDMHAHLLSDEALPDSLAGDELKIMVANGVTTIRLMIGTPEHLILRKQSAAGEIVAPTIYAASPQFSGRPIGEPFNGYVVKTGDEARAAVRKARADGYDFIKLTFFITREVYDAVIDEAAKQNIRVIGHVDRQVGLKRAFEAGQQIEHLDGFFEAMIPPEAKLPGSTSGVFVWQPRAWESLDVLDEKQIPDFGGRERQGQPVFLPDADVSQELVRHRLDR